MHKLKGLWHERATLSGLIVFFLSLNFFLGPIACWLYCTLKDFEKFKTSDTPIFLFVTLILAFVFANTLLLAVWFYWRSLPRFQSHENAILFAPHFDSECGGLVQSIFQRFVYELRQRVPNGFISPYFLPPNQKVQNSEEAHRLLNETGARLIVYGRFDQGQQDGQEIRGFKRVSFTLKHRDLMEWEQKAVTEDLGRALAYRAFTIQTQNSFIENDVVINNLAEVALFFVALALTLEAKLDIAITILEELYSNIEININTGKNPPHLRQFFLSIKRCYSIALDAKFMNFYNTHLLENITDRNQDDKFIQANLLLRKLLDIDSKKSLYYLRQAILDLHFGNVDQAFKSIGEAKKLANENEPSPHFSLAFLCIWKGQYKRAISEYGKVVKTDKHSLAVYSGVLDFIQCFHNKYPDRPEFLFALGFMNQNFFDIEQSARDYGDFLNQAEEAIKFLPLVNYAKEQLTLLQIALP
jgi:tetratricopeptide (TPR) repeat protein